jgi:hypothetical protein
VTHPGREPDHNRLLSAAAKAELVPLGCTQKGRSRTWLDDHDWWVTVVEFQPSAWSKGSYLNVGVCWLWYEKDYYSFDAALGAYGDRIESFHEFDGTDAFSRTARLLAQRARDEVLALRRQLSSLGSVASFVESKVVDNLWSDYHAGVAAGLAGNVNAAIRHFKTLEAAKCEYDWAHELKRRSAALFRAVEDTERFRSEIAAIVRRTRQLLRLPSAGEDIRFESQRRG